jgi:hypothetical protein
MKQVICEYVFTRVFFFFLTLVQRMQAYQSQSDVLVTFGCDFGYQNGKLKGKRTLTS